MLMLLYSREIKIPLLIYRINKLKSYGGNARRVYRVNKFKSSGKPPVKQPSNVIIWQWRQSGTWSGNIYDLLEPLMLPLFDKSYRLSRRIYEYLATINIDFFLPDLICCEIVKWFQWFQWSSMALNGLNVLKLLIWNGAVITLICTFLARYLCGALTSYCPPVITF